MYIHEQKRWPHFSWNQERIAPLLLQIRHQQGKLMGAMQSMGLQIEETVVLETLTQDAVKSSEIEGEILDRVQVHSSVARKLGLDEGGLTPIDRNVEGVVAMLVNATQQYNKPLTTGRLFQWHKGLFSTPGYGRKKMVIGGWRPGPVAVVSGALGREKVHFEGPSASRVNREMTLFLKWMNSKTKTDLVIVSALAHLWFVTIHPFEDGNGRIGRAIADLLLARSENSSRRFYSLSSQIQAERKDYYRILETTQKGGLDVTPWIEWFLSCLLRAIEKSLAMLAHTQHKAKAWDQISRIDLNERQRKILTRLLDGFEGKLTTAKWAKLGKCSQDTAYRDILDLIHKKILVKSSEGGRSTSYALKKFKAEEPA